MLRGLLIAALVAFATVAQAAPQLSVHARTEIRMKPIRKDYGGTYIVGGTLVDRFSGTPIPYQQVKLTFAGRTWTDTTADDGTFEMRVPAPGGRQDLVVQYAGDELDDPAKIELDDVDIDKNPVSLQITTAEAPDGVRVSVTASAGDTAVPLVVQLSVAPADHPDQSTALGTITAGGPPFVLTRKNAGGPGAKHLTAAFKGDSLYNPTTADANVELDTETKTTMSIRSRSVAYEDDLVATGRVVDGDGNGLAHVPVALLDRNDRHVTQTTTGNDGTFRFRVEGRNFGQGANRIQAIVEPTDTWMKGSRSDVLEIDVAAPQPVPIAYTIAAFALTALIAGGFFAARNRPWQRLRRAAPVDRERAPGEAREEPAGGLSLARPSLVSTLRRPADTGIAGVVRDAVRHRALPGARVAIALAGNNTNDALAGPDGAFAFEGLMPGEWKVEVACAGHVTERFSVTVPHRGELRGARIDLMPVRERIFSMYKRAALPLLPDPAKWGVWSPRQIFDHVRSKKLAPALAELTDFVERAYFSARLPDEDVLPDAAGRVERALREQAMV